MQQDVTSGSKVSCLHGYPDPGCLLRLRAGLQRSFPLLNVSCLQLSSKLESTDPIDAAIESAESLIASLLVKDHSSTSLVDGADGGEKLQINGEGDEKQSPLESKFIFQNPEQSLFSPLSDQSLVSEGVASQWLTTLTASSQATYPELDGVVSPKESLHAIGELIQCSRRLALVKLSCHEISLFGTIVCRASESSLLESPDFETVQKLLHEVRLSLFL